MVLFVHSEFCTVHIQMLCQRSHALSTMNTIWKPQKIYKTFSNPTLNIEKKKKKKKTITPITLNITRPSNIPIQWLILHMEKILNKREGIKTNRKRKGQIEREGEPQTLLMTNLLSTILTQTLKILKITISTKNMIGRHKVSTTRI